jgi:hypothetical protein
MAQHWQASAATAHGAVGIKTNIGAITTPKTSSKIVAVWVQTFGGAVITIAESISGILEIEGPDISTPLQFPLDQQNILTDGTINLPTHIIPVNVACPGGATLQGFTTLDDTVTAAMLHRWGICTE